jgi:hypothetical protein
MDTDIDKFAYMSLESYEVRNGEALPEYMEESEFTIESLQDILDIVLPWFAGYEKDELNFESDMVLLKKLFNNFTI